MRWVVSPFAEAVLPRTVPSCKTKVQLVTQCYIGSLGFHQEHGNPRSPPYLEQGKGINSSPTNTWQPQHQLHSLWPTASFSPSWAWEMGPVLSSWSSVSMMKSSDLGFLLQISLCSANLNVTGNQFARYSPAQITNTGQTFQTANIGNPQLQKPDIAALQHQKGFPVKCSEGIPVAAAWSKSQQKQVYKTWGAINQTLGTGSKRGCRAPTWAFQCLLTHANAAAAVEQEPLHVKLRVPQNTTVYQNALILQLFF